MQGCALGLRSRSSDFEASGLVLLKVWGIGRVFGAVLFACGSGPEVVVFCEIKLGSFRACASWLCFLLVPLPPTWLWFWGFKLGCAQIIDFQETA